MPPKPMLVVVSGPPGTGKTTLAHRLAAAVGCPAICRDEIKEGMVHATPGFVAAPGDQLSVRTLATFFDVLGLLIGRGTTVVAEAAFQDRLWRPGLTPLLPRADVRVVHCTVAAELAADRIAERSTGNPLRAAHEDALHTRERRLHLHTTFEPIDLAVPSLTVDTTDGYRPDVAQITRFLAR